MAEQKKLDILKNILGRYQYESKEQLLFSCPKCEHHKKKLSINVARNVFKCWVCGWSGRDLYRIVKSFGSFTEKQTWRALTQKVEISNFYDVLFGEKQEYKETLELPVGFVSLVNKNLPPTAAYPLNYLESRGIDKFDIVKWKIGYCTKGPFEGRIIIPSFDLCGDLNYFIARAYDGHWKRYKNPTVSKNIIFNELYLDFFEEVTLVEGVFDAIKAGENSIPLLGSTLNENSKLFRKIVEHDSTVYLALDSDADRKTNDIIDSLLRHDIEVYKINIGDFSDVGEMSHEQFKYYKSLAEPINSEQHFYNKIVNL